ncbi:MAG: ATP-binding protein [Chloroflexota bacterium]|nr:ATP-binding protein [Chloroflexota bacterium]
MTTRSRAIAADFGGDGFEVLFERHGGEVSIAVRDSGGWQPPQDELHRGHGLPLIRKLMDDVEIQPRPGGTTVLMRRQLAAAGGREVATG